MYFLKRPASIWGDIVHLKCIWRKKLMITVRVRLIFYLIIQTQTVKCLMPFFYTYEVGGKRFTQQFKNPNPCNKT